MLVRTWLISTIFLTSTSSIAYSKEIRKDAAPADLYIRLLDHAGSSSDFSAYESTFTRYFAPDIKKFVNGVCVANNREALRQNWQDARTTYGIWTIPNDYQVFESPQTNTVTIKHTAETTTNGRLLVIAILALEAGRISEIYEIYAPIS